MRQLKIATQITNRDSQAVEKYLQEISKIPMITPEEETTLAQRIKMGDQRALDKLVQANLRFVVSVAKQYQHQGLSLSDLINEGNLGLIKAAQRFDETKGFKFISYAVWWIRQSILQALAEQGRLVRLPQNKIGTYNKANKAYMAFEQEHEREPSTEELADILEMSETEINNIFQSNTRHTSLDAPVHEAEDVAMGDLLQGSDDTDDVVMKDSLRNEIRRVLKSLSPEKQKLLMLTLGLMGRMALLLNRSGRSMI
jgi:RNA polymerase primary sigma factor